MTSDRKNWVFSSSADPGLIRIPPKGKIRLSVPMRVQGQNPICWIACASMILSYKGKASIGIGSFTGGFDPSNSSIPNPVTSWVNYYRILSMYGFANVNPFPNRSPEAGYILDLLRRHGPWMLAHYTSNLFLGTFNPDSAHAIVITGIDTKTNKVWFNNPWGRIDDVTTANKILFAMENLLKRGIRSVAYMP